MFQKPPALFHGIRSVFTKDIATRLYPPELDILGPLFVPVV